MLPSGSIARALNVAKTEASKKVMMDEALGQDIDFSNKELLKHVPAPSKEFKLREDFQLRVPEPGQPKPTETPEEAVARVKATAGVCPRNEKTHRHSPTNLVTPTTSGCRYCGEQIERAHDKSTWWNLKVVDPSKKPSKALLRAKKKMLRKAFARKDQIGSTRADSKRAAHAFVEKKLGQKVSWKRARKELARMARRERGVANG